MSLDGLGSCSNLMCCWCREGDVDRSGVKLGDSMEETGKGTWKFRNVERVAKGRFDVEGRWLERVGGGRSGKLVVEEVNF